MLKKTLLIGLILSTTACAELQQIAENLPEIEQNAPLGNEQIANGLKEALTKGIDDQVQKLTQKNGFYNNPLVKIALPEELQKVENVLRDIGLGSLADKGIEALNHTAEEAVKEATPIFVNAIQEMSIKDAKNILLGQNNAATQYLEEKTNTELYNKFKPVIENSFAKVGANEIWSNIIERYNNIPLTNNVNPNLTDYVTQEALNGVYKMIAVEEKDIRENINSRTSDLLKKVFALQD